MSTAHHERLQHARRLLQDGRRADALDVLKRVLYDDRTNVEAWWLAAQAAPNREEARAALRALLKLQPDHEPARDLLARLESPAVPPTAQTTPQRPVQPVPKPAAPKSAPPRRAARPTRKRGRRNLVTLTIIAISFSVISAGSLLFILNLMGSPLLTEIESGLTGQEIPTATPAMVWHGAQISGTIRVGERQEFVFEATAGTEMFVGVGYVTVPAGADTTGAVELIDPDGYIMTRSSPEGADFELPPLPVLETGSVTILQTQLDMDGLWRLRLVGYEGASSGAYILIMQCYPERGCLAPPPVR